MNLHRFVVCCAVGCALPIGVARAADPPPAASPGDRAADLYKRATDLYRGNTLAEAQKLYLEAWAVQQSYDIATNLGAVELDLGMYRDAAEHLSFALRAFPARGKEDERATIAKRLALARAEVVTLRVVVNVEKADVTVNGKRAGIAPIAEDLFAATESVVVEASLDGYEPARQTFKAKKGEARDVALTLTARSGTEPSKLPAFIAFGVGGAGLVMGAIAGGAAAARTSDLKKVCGESLECPPSERDNLNAANTTAHVSTTGFILAGVGVVAGVTLLLVPRGQKSKAQASLLLGPGFAGVKGAF